MHACGSILWRLPALLVIKVEKVIPSETGYVFSRRMFCNTFPVSAALVEVCALLSSILVFFGTSCSDDGEDIIVRRRTAETGMLTRPTGSKAKTPSLKAKACQLNPRPGQDQDLSWTRPIISA